MHHPDGTLMAVIDVTSIYARGKKLEIECLQQRMRPTRGEGRGGKGDWLVGGPVHVITTEANPVMRSGSRIIVSARQDQRGI